MKRRTSVTSTFPRLSFRKEETVHDDSDFSTRSLDTLQEVYGLVCGCKNNYLDSCKTSEDPKKITHKRCRCEELLL